MYAGKHLSRDSTRRKARHAHSWGLVDVLELRLEALVDGDCSGLRSCVIDYAGRREMAGLRGDDKEVAMVRLGQSRKECLCCPQQSQVVNSERTVLMVVSVSRAVPKRR